MKTKNPHSQLQKLLISMYQAYPAYYIGPYETEFPEEIRESLHKNQIVIKTSQKSKEGKTLYSIGNNGLLLVKSYQNEATLKYQKIQQEQLRTANLFLTSLIVIVLLIAFLMLIIPLS